MTKTILASLLFLSPCFAAAISSTLTVLDADLAGDPGSTVAWGFTLTSDTDPPLLWISVVESATMDESDSDVGVYTDLIGSQGGPVNAVLAPFAPAWTEAFGLGSYAIDPNATPGAVDRGTIDVLIQRSRRIRTSAAVAFRNQWI